MMKYEKILLAAATAIILYAPALHAAPFCVEKQGMPAECNFYDAVECRKRSEQVSGVCSVNPAEIRLQPGVGKYCVVDSNHVSMCQYADRTSCDNDAVRYGAVCIEYPSADVQPNPYRIDPNSKY